MSAFDKSDPLQKDIDDAYLSVRDVCGSSGRGVNADAWLIYMGLLFIAKAIMSLRKD